MGHVTQADQTFTSPQWGVGGQLGEGTAPGAAVSRGPWALSRSAVAARHQKHRLHSDTLSMGLGVSLSLQATFHS